MEKVGIFYGSSTGNSQIIAYMIRKKIGLKTTDIYDVSNTDATQVIPYKNLIFGVSTWGDGEIQDDWKEYLNKLNDIPLHKKKIALYGLGDQFTYYENFLDGMGILHSLLSGKNCSFVGSWPTEGYIFHNSKALVGGKFVGLALDEDAQYEHTGFRVEKWVDQLKNEFY